MNASVTHISTRRQAAVKLQCLILAQLNEEKAGYCDKQQAGLREFLLMNAKLLRKVAES